MTPSDHDFRGRTALVTGAASGIGAATAELLAALGAAVLVADVRAEPARRTADRIGCEHVALDVSDPTAWERAVDAVVERHGRLDILVNAAGVFEIKSIAETSADFFERTIAVNQLGTFFGMQAAARPMAAARGGSIINVSSVAGLSGRPGTMAYSTTKWAVRGMTKVAAKELAPAGIRVNTVLPGAITTPMLDDLKGDRGLLGAGLPTPLGRRGEPVEIARLIAFLASDAGSYCTGAEFVCDGGMTVM